jgi:DNA-binding Xre family transcriptional regulator
MKMLLLDKYLKLNNITLEELADELGVDASRITAMCDDEHAALDFKLYEQICIRLNCDVTDLIIRD